MPKEDFLPGQTKELDPNGADTEALTIFYTTLYQQKPESELAAKTLLQFGLLPGGEEEAKKLMKKLGKAGVKLPAAPKSKVKVCTHRFEPARP